MQQNISNEKDKKEIIIGRRRNRQQRTILLNNELSSLVERKCIPTIIKQHNANEVFSHSYQVDLINSIQSIPPSDYLPHHAHLIQELSKKRNGYKNQDKVKRRIIIDPIITILEIIELLIQSSLKCYYCNQLIYIFYQYLREPKQWTLDRIDNNLRHTNNNCVISCLACNLQRRRVDAEKFTFTKQFVLIKLSGDDSKSI